MTEEVAIVNGGDYRGGEAARVGSKQSRHQNMNGATRTISPLSLVRPQISIEHVEPDEMLPNSPPSLSCLLPGVKAGTVSPHPTSSSSSSQPRSKVYVPLNDGSSSPQRRTVSSSSSGMPTNYAKSYSLPSGLLLEDIPRFSSSSGDTPESDSSDGRQSGPANTDSPLIQRYHGYQVKVKDGGETRRGRGGGAGGGDGRRGRLSSIDSDLGSSSEEVSSDEVHRVGTPPIAGKFFKSSSVDTANRDQDDDVFQDGELDFCSETDGKLVHWAFSVFVPACRMMLFHCAEEPVDARQIQLDLRNLSNLIGFFCNEHQRISTLLRPHKRLKQSRSASNFSRLEVQEEKLGSPNIPSMSSRTSISSNSSNGYDSMDSLAERSYAVKVLRSISASLIAPLLKKASKGFTAELYQSLVVALQKISWKVEACLSFNNCAPEGANLDIHGGIFDIEQSVRVRDMMIKTLPPEELKLQTVAPGGRHASVSSKAYRLPPEHPLESTLSPCPASQKKRERNCPGGILFEAGETPSTELEELSQNQDEETPLRSHEVQQRTGVTPNRVRRVRTTTLGDSEAISRRSKVLSKLDDSDQATGEDAVEFLRPKAQRRTTISLSRREVHKLGLTVAKRIDESILDEIQAKQLAFSSVQMPGSREKGETAEQDVAAENEWWEGRNKATEGDLEKVQGILHVKLTKEFDRIRSASLADLLDHDDSRGDDGDRENPRSASSVMQLEGLGASSGDSRPTSPRILTFVPSIKHKRSRSTASTDLIVDEEWTYVEKSTSKSKSKSKPKKAVDSHSISSSGKFTRSLKKTARMLRHGSTSVPNTPIKSSLRYQGAGSEEMLTELPNEQELLGPRSVSALSDPTMLRSSPSFDARTLPAKGRMNSLTRWVKKRRVKTTSNKTDSIAVVKDRWSTQPQGQDYASGGVFTESIENFSKGASRLLQLELDERLLVSVVIAGKLPKSKSPRKRTSSIISRESSHTWYEITVTTNMKQFGRNHYTILRPFKEIQKLYDTLCASHGGFSHQLPERPDKKTAAKRQPQQIEELLRCIAGNLSLRSSEVFVDFLMPDDAFGRGPDDSEVSFELLMTFYTPDVYEGPPGSSHSVQVVSPEDVPSPSTSRKHSTLPHKRGSLHFIKKDGKEDTTTFVIRDEGRDALIVSCDDDRYVVAAGTFGKLVEQLACEEKPDPRFVTTFLLGYRHFATTMDVLTMLLRRFHITLAPDATDEEMVYDEKWRYVIQLRVLDILLYWMKKCWPDFYRNPPVLDKVREFAHDMKASEDTNFHSAGANIEKLIKEKLVTSVQYELQPSPGPATPRTPKSPKSPEPLTLEERTPSVAAAVSVTRPHRILSSSSSTGPVDISTLTAIQLARQLTLIELELLRAIDTHELVVYTWEPNTPENKPYRRNVDAFIARFNKVSYWVASEICSVSDARSRAALLEKFVEVAKHCHEYKNYNTLISILSGVSLAAVRRLKRSWQCVSEKTQKSFTKLSLIVSPSNNHINYRRALSTVHRRDPCIPYFGVFMRDLTFFNDGNHKTLKNGLINFSKLRTMVLKFYDLKRYQRSKYFFPPEDKTRDFCRNLWCMSEHDLYEASLSVEPRDPPPLPDSPSPR